MRHIQQRCGAPQAGESWEYGQTVIHWFHLEKHDIYANDGSIITPGRTVSADVSDSSHDICARILHLSRMRLRANAQSSTSSDLQGEKGLAEIRTGAVAFEARHYDQR